MTAGAVAVAAVGAYIIAKHQASERQRKIAEQRARLYMARQEAARKAAAQQSASTAKRKTTKPRYIAVKTVKEENSQGKDQVMIFDTQSNQIVGNNVYDLKSSPRWDKRANSILTPPNTSERVPRSLKEWVANRPEHLETLHDEGKFGPDGVMVGGRRSV